MHVFANTVTNSHDIDGMCSQLHDTQNFLCYDCLVSQYRDNIAQPK